MRAARTPLSRAAVLLLLAAGVGYAIGTALVPFIL